MHSRAAHILQRSFTIESSASGAGKAEPAEGNEMPSREANRGKDSGRGGGNQEQERLHVDRAWQNIALQAEIILEPRNRSASWDGKMEDLQQEVSLLQCACACVFLCGVINFAYGTLPER